MSTHSHMICMYLVKYEPTKFYDDEQFIPRHKQSDCLDEIEILLEQTNKSTNDSVLALQETWFTEVLFYISIHFTCSINIWDALFLDTKCSLSNIIFLIGNLYRPPHKHVEDLNYFSTEFPNILISNKNVKGS